MTDWVGDLVTRAHDTLVSHPEAAEARDYLRSRKVDESLWQAHELGYSHVSVEIASCTQAFADWFPKYWFSRLVFPLRNLFGRPIGLVTRPLPSAGDKRTYQQFYAESQEVYPYLFGLDRAGPEIWRTRQVVIVEGVFDYLALAPFVPNTVAILTANVPAAVRKFFTRYVKRVWAALDMDAAGRMGAYRLAGLEPPREVWPEGWTPGPVRRPEGYQVRIVSYDGGKDPGEASMNGHLPHLISRVAGATAEFTP